MLSCIEAAAGTFDSNPLSAYLSSLKLVLVVLRLGQLALSRVSQVSVDGEEHIGICPCSVHVTRPHGYLVRANCGKTISQWLGNDSSPQTILSFPLTTLGNNTATCRIDESSSGILGLSCGSILNREGVATQDSVVPRGDDTREAKS